MRALSVVNMVAVMATIDGGKCGSAAGVTGAAGSDMYAWPFACLGANGTSGGRMCACAWKSNGGTTEAGASGGCKCKCAYRAGGATADVIGSVKYWHVHANGARPSREVV